MNTNEDNHNKKLFLDIVPSSGWISKTILYFGHNLAFYGYLIFDK